MPASPPSTIIRSRFRTAPNAVLLCIVCPPWLATVLTHRAGRTSPGLSEARVLFPQPRCLPSARRPPVASSLPCGAQGLRYDTPDRCHSDGFGQPGHVVLSKEGVDLGAHG